jgi:tetratricopeptide (TPR) repeat protein
VRQAIGGRRLLLILDGVWQIEDALAFQLGGPTCASVVITRFRDVAAYLSMQAALELKELSVTESLHLMSLLTSQVVEGAWGATRALVQAVGGLPLALTLLGHVLRQQTYSGQPRRLHAAFLRVSTGEQRLQMRVPSPAGEEGAWGDTERFPSLESVIALSDARLSRGVRQTFYALAVLPAKPHSFSEAAALAVSQGQGEHLDALVDAGLLEQAEGRYRLHQTISDYASLHLTGAAWVQAQTRLIAQAVAYVEQGQPEADRMEQDAPTLLLALESAAQLGRWGELVSLLLALMPLFLLRGSYALAEQYVRRAQQSSQPLSAIQQLHLLHAQGQTAHKQGRYDQARRAFQQGLTLARQQGQQDLLTILLADLGWVSWKCGAYAQAQECVEEGLALARQRQDRQGMSCLLQQLGVIQARRGQYRESEACLREGLTLARQLGEPERCCLLLLNLGTTLLNRGAYGPAETALQEGLALARQMRHREWISLVLLNLADLVLMQRQEELALAYVQEGLTLARQIEHRELMSGHLVNQGMIAYHQGDYQQAEAALTEGIQLAQQTGIPYLIGYAHYEAGNCALAQQKWEAAQEAFAAMEQVGREPEQELRALACYGQGRVAQAQGQPEHAYALGQASLHLLEEIGQEEKAREVRHWLSTQARPMDAPPHAPAEPEEPGT